jgi:hypothetical protein
MKWGGMAGAGTAIIALAATLGADLIPWPAKAQVENLEKAQENTIIVQEKIIERLDRSERRYWLDIEQRAEDELRENPDSASAKRELKRARDNIRELDAQ